MVDLNDQPPGWYPVLYQVELIPRWLHDSRSDFTDTHLHLARRLPRRHVPPVPPI